MKIAWYSLIEHLIQHLKSIQVLDDHFNIGVVGVEDDTNKPSKIEIDWDCESNISNSLPYNGSVVLYVDVLYRNDSTDPMIAFKEQYETQKIIIGSIADWHDKILSDMGVATLIKIPGIATYGKTMRPNYNNRIVLDIEWKDSGRRR